jgi:hypothetical protein
MILEKRYAPTAFQCSAMVRTPNKNSSEPRRTRIDRSARTALRSTADAQHRALLSMKTPTNRFLRIVLFRTVLFLLEVRRHCAANIALRCVA